MIDLGQINSIFSLILVLASIFGGGVTAFFIIKRQLLSITNSALLVTQEELKVYREKVDRLERDLENISNRLKLISQENLGLISERDYLKSLIISSITSRKDIHKELMDELKKAPTGDKLFRDGVDIKVEASQSKK